MYVYKYIWWTKTEHIDALNIHIDAPNRFRIDASNTRIYAPTSAYMRQ